MKDPSDRFRYVVAIWDGNDCTIIFRNVLVDERADSPSEDAIAIADRMYPDFVAGAALTAEDLRRMADELECEQRLPFADDAGELPREECVRILTARSIECRDDEDLGTLQEAVRSGLEEGDISIADLC